MDSNKKDKKWDYHDFGKLVIWEEMAKLFKNGYKYYQYSNNFDGTRDKYGYWVTTTRFFSDIEIPYENPENMLFIVMYNSGMDDYKKMSREKLLNSNMIISKFFRKSLD